MEITEAPEIPETEEVPVQLEVTEGLEQEITKDIETGKKPKKPRTEAQKAAFMKAREALAEKRKAAAEEKVLNKKKAGRPRNPPKVKEEVVPATQEEKKELNAALRTAAETGDAEAVGKAVGKDHAAGKATFVSLLGLDGAKSRAVELVDEACDALDVYREAANTLKAAARFVVQRTH
jgi:hypothetical protein